MNRLRSLVVVGTFATSAVLAPLAASPASADSCNHNVRYSVTKVRTYVSDRVNGADSHFNRKDDGKADTVSVTYGRSVTRQVNKHWEVGGEVEGGLGPVKAKISAKYGKAYVEAATTNKSTTRTMTIEDGWTGWIRVDFYRRVVVYKGVTERWDADKKRCVDRVVEKAVWKAPKAQYVTVKKKGKVYPG